MVTEMQQNLVSFDGSLRAGHQSIQEINKQMDSLIAQIQSVNSSELSSILGNVKEIAKRYNLLETDTISLIKTTSAVAGDVSMAAQSALNGELTTAEALQSMNRDFEGLENRMTKVIERHAEVAKELRDQADNAKKAKERNDQLEAYTLKLNQDAETFGALAIPGVMLIKAPILVASEAAGAVDNKALKIVAGIGGAVGGLIGGVVMTALTPIFAVLALHCAWASTGWSQNFADLSQQILAVEAAIINSNNHLSVIRGMLPQLDEKISQFDQIKTNPLLKKQLKKILTSCAELKKNCSQYLLSVQGVRYNQPMLLKSTNAQRK